MHTFWCSSEEECWSLTRAQAAATPQGLEILQLEIHNKDEDLSAESLSLAFLHSAPLAALIIKAHSLLPCSFFGLHFVFIKRSRGERACEFDKKKNGIQLMSPPRCYHRRTVSCLILSQRRRKDTSMSQLKNQVKAEKSYHLSDTLSDSGGGSTDLDDIRSRTTSSTRAFYVYMTSLNQLPNIYKLRRNVKVLKAKIC